jgi:hypothetical protein
MASSSIVDADALVALSQLLQPPTNPKPVFDIISALPRELALEVIGLGAPLRPQSPYSPLCLSLL